MKIKIIAKLVLGMAFLSAPICNAQNIITDGDFSSTTVITPFYGTALPNIWYSFQTAVEASATVVDGVCNYQITSSGYYTWEIQLMQFGFPLIQGHSYRLSFDVRADANRTFGVFLGEDDGNWTNLLGNERYLQNATTEWQTITLDFKTSCIFAYHKLSFELGTINTSMYFDNVSLTDLGPYQTSVGILGSSLSGWDVDIDMATSDGIIYYSDNLPLAAGRVKFRADDNWCVNWGSVSFPTGTGYQFGPDIQVSNPGTYDITFNRETGEYTFTCVEYCSPLIGIAGTAVPPDFGMGPDVNMTTYDGINYILYYTFTDGEVKFRQDDNPDITWGSTGFPSGVASLGGPSIPVAAGTYTLKFNIVTGDYSFNFPSIGVLGDALPGWWYEDVDMSTTDGIIYTLTDYPFSTGEVKFRQDNDWSVNWGNYTFPSGWGYQNGPNIPVPYGTYTVTFNRLTGEYSFVATSCPVAAVICPDYIYTASTTGMCGAEVFYPPVIPAANCGGPGVEITQIGGLPSGALFPVGMTTNTFMLTNEQGSTAYCSFDVYVGDYEPPVIEGLSGYFEPLWPANHKMVNVPIDYYVSDNCGNAYSELYVYSTEPVNGLGDGDTSPDWEIIDEHNVLLRAERSALGEGREYHIIIFCHDDYWNYSFSEVVVSVPHDMDYKSSEVMPFRYNVWPNPSSGAFTLQVGSDQDGMIEVSVSDINGRTVSQLKMMNMQTISFGEELLPGTYMLNLKQGENSVTLKLLKH